MAWLVVLAACCHSPGDGGNVTLPPLPTPPEMSSAPLDEATADIINQNPALLEAWRDTNRDAIRLMIYSARLRVHAAEVAYIVGAITEEERDAIVEPLLSAIEQAEQDIEVKM